MNQLEKAEAIEIISKSINYVKHYQRLTTIGGWASLVSSAMNAAISIHSFSRHFMVPGIIFGILSITMLVVWKRNKRDQDENTILLNEANKLLKDLEAAEIE